MIDEGTGKMVASTIRLVQYANQFMATSLGLAGVIADWSAQTLHRMNSHERHDQNDPFNLDRFVSAQEHVFDNVLSELRRGRKESHWMWFIFPQLDGLGSSSTARKYAITSLREARAYLEHSILGAPLLECCRAILQVHGKSASDIMGYPDDVKLKSSMTLFSLVSGSPPECKEVLEKYFSGQSDPRTLELLNVRS